MDGEILFQYLAVQNDDSITGDCHNYATTGILGPDGEDGLLITFANQYPPGASLLGPERAIKFTPIPPDSYIGIREREKEGGRRWRKPTIVRLSSFIQERKENGGGKVFLYDATGRRIGLDWVGSLTTGIYFLELEKGIRKVIILK